MRALDLLHISLADQRLYGFADGQLLLRLPVSTALNGPGELNGSGCTPRGLHRVRAKIGEGLPVGAVLRGRRWTGELWSAELAARFPERDWILSRILWLSGCEPGRNRLGAVDTFRRYIYLHGTSDSEPMGEPRSHGCIRLRNADLVELFPRVPLNCMVRIDEAACPDWATAPLN
ncbi:L,D-transpeptidase [Pseudomonas lalucatii]|uniref:L,D-transpeptidase n=1 Tax=Pseudomonas lalucatii TaxID=1424203 RepID=A0ABS5PXL7_9PSED|nr:L,D-transpeptidase [Pseudomonas lalucatii]MBS7661245.1 L,D-transpeptidase [Pseudomonas lalucatii]MBS7691686.1 L,D-transpeptidase [Pseudomonas lalucatii]QVM87799.1 L,D-transpeptidase [Pseudomonas lalucatii]